MQGNPKLRKKFGSLNKKWITIGSLWNEPLSTLSISAGHKRTMQKKNSPKGNHMSFASN
jgi:hypothetical protein